MWPITFRARVSIFRCSVYVPAQQLSTVADMREFFMVYERITKGIDYFVLNGIENNQISSKTYFLE